MQRNVYLSSLVLLTFLACYATLASAQTPLPASASPPRAVLLDLTGRTLTGQLVKADFAGAIHIADNGKPTIVPAADVIWLGIDAQPQTDPRPVPWFADDPLPGRPAPTPLLHITAILRTDEVLVGHPAADSAPDALLLEHPLLGRLSLPFAQIRQIRLTTDPAGLPSRGRPAASPPMAALDLVLLANGDRVEGIVRAIGPKQVVLESAEGERRELPADSVRAVHLAEVPAAASAPASRTQPSRQPEAWLHLRSGEAIRTRGLVYDPARAGVTFTRQGQPVSVPLEGLTGIEPISPRWQWLTALSPSRYEHRPLLAPSLQWQADATCTGSPIRCDGQPVLHGIGVPAGSTLQYDLAGKWRSLIVWPMLDDSAAQAGPCAASIRVDDREAWKGSIKPATTQPAAVIGLAGKHDLLLQVDPSPTGDVLTRFVWAWAVVVK